MKIRSLALILAVTIGAGTGMNGMTVCAEEPDNISTCIQETDSIPMHSDRHHVHMESKDNIPVPAESKGSLPTYTGSIYSLPIVSEDKIPDILDVHDIPKRGSAEASVPSIKYIDPSLPSEYGDINGSTVNNKKSPVSEDECVASENAFTESADDPEYVFAEIVPDPVLRQKIAESSESAIAPDAVKVTQSQLDQVVELYAEWPGGWEPGHYDASGKVRDVTGIHYLRNVDTIYLCDNDLDQTDTTEFRDLKKLNYLDVTGNRLTDIPDVRGCVSFVGGGLVVYDNNIPQEKFSKEHIRSRVSEKVDVESIQEQMYEQVYPNESKTLRLPKVSCVF
jgi:Leucine-rich repeat (LRR) protein